MNEKKLSRPLISLIVSIALIIVGIAGSFILQTNSGKTTIRNVTIESESGHTLAMDVYIPENATAETPAPAIFVQHGGNNNKEEMQHYCIELARRGYVAIGVDMYGMGESEPLPDSEWLTQGRGLYDAVRYGVTLPSLLRTMGSLWIRKMALTTFRLSLSHCSASPARQNM